jgi:hypothetical protein
VANDLVTDCATCEPCTDTGDGFACVATSHDYAACVGDDIYWFDSCDVQEEIHTDCLACETCVLIMGNPTCQAADLQDHLECYTDDVWWFDSCGNPSEMYDDCGTNEYCEAALDPPACECMPGWVGLDCDEYICDSVTDTSEDCPDASTIGRNDLPVSITGDTTPFSDDVNFTCDGWPQPGRDLVFKLYLFAGETIDVDLDHWGDDLSVHLLQPDPMSSTDACNDMNLIACDDTDGGWANDTFTHTVTEDGWYYIVVDAWQPTVYGAFQLDVDILNPVVGQCYGGTITPCVNQYLYFDWEEPPATITAPMVVMASSVISGMYYIYTSAQDDGTAERDFDIPCDDTWYMWGLRWKPSDDLATFRFRVDGNPLAPITWDVSGGTDWEWDWDQANGAMTAVWSELLTTGTHTLTVLGGESDGGAVADHPALGFIIFTNDPAFVPPDPATL